MAGDLKKLEGRSDEWRFRVGGYRVRFRLDGLSDEDRRDEHQKPEKRVVANLFQKSAQ